MCMIYAEQLLSIPVDHYHGLFSDLVHRGHELGMTIHPAGVRRDDSSTSTCGCPSSLPMNPLAGTIKTTCHVALQLPPSQPFLHAQQVKHPGEEFSDAAVLPVVRPSEKRCTPRNPYLKDAHAQTQERKQMRHLCSRIASIENWCPTRDAYLWVRHTLNHLYSGGSRCSLCFCGIVVQVGAGYFE